MIYYRYFNYNCQIYYFKNLIYKYNYKNLKWILVKWNSSKNEKFLFCQFCVADTDHFDCSTRGTCNFNVTGIYTIFI